VCEVAPNPCSLLWPTNCEALNGARNHALLFPPYPTPPQSSRQPGAGLGGERCCVPRRGTGLHRSLWQYRVGITIFDTRSMFICSRFNFFLLIPFVCTNFKGNHFFDTNQDYVSCVDLNIATHVKSYVYMFIIQVLSMV
jgi:hypothetical protein